MSGIVKAPCADCARQTSHDILFTKELGGSWCRKTFDMLQCRGCHAVSLREISDYTGGRATPSVTYYPPLVSRVPPGLAMIMDIEYPGAETFGQLLREVYTATNNSLWRLAVMGIRAILEQVIISNIGDRGRFKANLEAFKEAGYISLIQFDTLDSVLNAGHAVIHRNFQPTEADVGMALDIMEGLLASVYVHKEHSELLSRPEVQKPLKPRPES